MLCLHLPADGPATVASVLQLPLLSHWCLDAAWDAGSQPARLIICLGCNAAAVYAVEQPEAGASAGEQASLRSKASARAGSPSPGSLLLSDALPSFRSHHALDIPGTDAIQLLQWRGAVREGACVLQGPVVVRQLMLAQCTVRQDAYSMAVLLPSQARLGPHGRKCVSPECLDAFGHRPPALLHALRWATSQPHQGTICRAAEIR